MRTKLPCMAFVLRSFIVAAVVSPLLFNAAYSQDDLQGALTLTYKNFLVPPTANYFFQGADPAGVLIPTKGPNQKWDYSNLTKNNANNSTISYVPANNPAYPDALLQFDNYFSLAGIPIAQTNMEGNDQNSYHGLGTHFERQAFSLKLLTGNINDSLIIIEQNVQEPDQLFEKYPVTYQASFNSHSISVTNFQLTIAAFGLNHTPGQFVQHTYDKREVVGWGKLRIPTSTGPSDWIKGLLQKLSVLKIDSVYLAGAPAPGALLAAFGVTQGETSNSFYEYRFYRKGIEAYLINFSTDITFTNIKAINYDTKYADIYCNGGIKMCNSGTLECVPNGLANYALLNNGATIGSCNNIIAGNVAEDNFSAKTIDTKIFPNPSSNEFNIQLSEISSASVYVYDLFGRQVQKFENVSGKLRVGKEWKQGIYMVQVIQNNQKKTFKLIKGE